MIAKPKAGILRRASSPEKNRKAQLHASDATKKDIISEIVLIENRYRLKLNKWMNVT